jgi:hypothetical protein
MPRQVVGKKNRQWMRWRALESGRFYNSHGRAAYRLLMPPIRLLTGMAIENDRSWAAWPLQVVIRKLATKTAEISI